MAPPPKHTTLPSCQGPVHPYAHLLWTEAALDDHLLLLKADVVRLNTCSSSSNSSTQCRAALPCSDLCTLPQDSQSCNIRAIHIQIATAGYRCCGGGSKQMNPPPPSPPRHLRVLRAVHLCTTSWVLWPARALTHPPPPFCCDTACAPARGRAPDRE
jgi:hypothetical protein